MLTYSSTVFESQDINANGEKYLLLQASYHPDQISITSGSSNKTSKPGTNPPSPLPCYSTTFDNDDIESISINNFHSTEEEDVLSATSKSSSRSIENYRHYDFLKSDGFDDHYSSLAKRKVCRSYMNYLHLLNNVYFAI